MKKAIFLVEDIKDGEIFTLLESAYKPINDDLKSKGQKLLWLSEISTLLYKHPSDWITFVKVGDFIKNNSIPADKDVYYFISCLHNLDMFGVSNFLLLKPEVVDFLVKHHIPIVIDSSMEICDHEASSYNLLEKKHLIKDKKMFRGLDTLEYYIVGSSVQHDIFKLPRTIKTYHSVFPGPFFQYNYQGSEFNETIVKDKETILSAVKNRKLSSDLLTWQAYSNKTRLNRGLFFLKAEKNKLLKSGRYSRLLPGKDEFIKECQQFRFDYLKVLNDPNLEILDIIKKIDSSTGKVIPANDFRFLIWLVLETFSGLVPRTTNSRSSFLTEKTAMAIASASPFIPLGGPEIGKQLLDAGFKQYHKLEFPTQPNIIDEVDYIIDRIKEINNLPLTEKQRLYDQWKDTIVYNYDRYIDIDVKKYYLEILNKSRRPATTAK